MNNLEISSFDIDRCNQFTPFLLEPASFAKKRPIWNFFGYGFHSIFFVEGLCSQGIRQKVLQTFDTIPCIIQDRTIFVIQLNKYQKDLYFFESSQQMTNDDCLLISGFLPIFDCSCVLGTKNCSASLNFKPKQVCVPVLQMFSNLVNFQKSTNNFMSNHG